MCVSFFQPAFITRRSGVFYSLSLFVSVSIIFGFDLSSLEISIIRGGGTERERERERDGFHGSVVAWRASILVDNCFIIAVSGEGIITRVGPQLSNRNNGTKRVVIFFFLPESSQSQCLSVDNIMAAFYEDTFLSFRAIFPPIIDSLSR